MTTANSEHALDARTSRTDIAAREFDPHSLVGSFFLGDEEHQWQGMVVAEPAPGTYLCEFFEWFTGGSTQQRLVRIGEMFGWTFYDSDKWLQRSYDGSIRHRWERARRKQNGEEE